MQNKVSIFIDLNVREQWYYNNGNQEVATPIHFVKIGPYHKATAPDMSINTFISPLVAEFNWHYFVP